MKKVLILILLAGPAFAADVTITSFYRLDVHNIQNTTAEVCGEVKGTLTGNEKIFIVADPGNREGEYMTTVSPKGHYCQVISAYNNVEVQLVNQKNQVTAKAARGLR